MKPVRVAGLLYLLLALTGAPGLIIPRTLIVPGDAAATADRIRTSEWLFRLGIASELISAIIFIFVVLALYRVFKGVNQERASLMVILVLVSVPISFLAVASAIGALALLRVPVSRQSLDNLSWTAWRWFSFDFMARDKSSPRSSGDFGYSRSRLW